jgi:hypothetical protein
VPPEIITYLKCVRELAFLWNVYWESYDQTARTYELRVKAARTRSDAIECFHSRFMPGTDVEEKAIEFAVILLKLFADELSAERARAELIIGVTAHLMLDWELSAADQLYLNAADQLVCDDRLSRFVRSANDGDPLADEAVRFDATIRLLGGKPLPEPLLSYVVAIVDGRPPKMRRGQHPVLLRSRDFYIATTVQEVTRLGFWATRNRERRNEEASACAVVAKALARMNRAMSERAVEVIWGKFDHSGQAVEAAVGK